MRTFDQWYLFMVAVGVSVTATRDYVNGHWWYAGAETVLAVFAWLWLGRFRRRIYGTSLPRKWMIPG